MLDEYSEFLSIDDVCEILMIGRNTVYKLLKEGVIKAFRLGRVWKIPKQSIELLAKGETGL